VGVQPPAALHHHVGACPEEDRPDLAPRYLASMERGAAYHGALRAVSASWLRVLWRCWQDGTTYNPTRHRPNN
jgi:hypothetical protein